MKALRTVVLLTIAGLALVLFPPAFPGAAALSPPTGYVPVGPSRVADTRVGEPTVDGGGPRGVVGAGGVVDVVVAGRGGVPVGGVGAVVLNVTVVGPSGAGFVTVWPSGSVRPLASSVNFVPGQVVANQVVAQVGAGGRVSLFNSAGSSHLVVDVAGWFPVGADYSAVGPSRVADTRVGEPTVDGGGPRGVVGAGGVVDVVVAGRGGVPVGGVGAVVLNVTVVGPSGAGFVTVWPSGSVRPLASSVNFVPGQVVANQVVAQVGAGGRVSLFNSAGSSHLVVDVAGWFPVSQSNVVVAAGDIACSPASAQFNAGLGTSRACRQRATALAAATVDPVAVLGLGDHQYDTGTLAQFQGSFAPSWGRFVKTQDAAVNRYWPVPGNHEYADQRPGLIRAAGYWAYFNGGTEASPSQSGIAGTTGQGWYSKNVAGWHVIALNSECAALGVQACGPNSAQYKWLQQDLAADHAACTIAMWHRPLFNVGQHPGEVSMRAIWQLLDQAGVDVVLNGHDHNYQRYGPLDVDGASDPNGMREFVVGGAGSSLYAFTDPIGAPQPQARSAQTLGVLAMSLDPGGYSWEFVSASFDGNGSFTDSGSALCH